MENAKIINSNHSNQTSIIIFFKALVNHQHHVDGEEKQKKLEDVASISTPVAFLLTLKSYIGSGFLAIVRIEN